MRSREYAIRLIFSMHGASAIYVASTGHISRAIYDIYPNNNNIFYMKGSMGLAPAIGLGIALSTRRTVVVLNGDASHLMHLGLTHTIRDADLDNLFVYILDNGCHESVGGHKCSPLENSYPGIYNIWKIFPDKKPPRIGITFEENSRRVMEFIEC